jgi:hypothetical protein
VQIGDCIKFKHLNQFYEGKILKIYTQVGGPNHDKEVVCVLVDTWSGLFSRATISVLKNDIELL